MYHVTRPKGIPQGGGTLRVCQRTQQSDEHPSHRKRFAYGKSAIHFRSLSPSCLSGAMRRSEEHTSELQSRLHLVCRLLLEKKKNPKHSHGGAAVAFGLNGNGSGIAMESCALLGRR